MRFSELLIDWYEQNHRSLPWRDTGDAYKIWLSEIILQQTRVNQGMPYYLRFVERFPDVRALALASEEEVLALWQGLGYYSRARNLHKAAQIIHTQYNDIFPKEYEQIKVLPGIGAYTAAAVASFAFALPYPVVDGNVIRFICRLDGIYEPVHSSVCRNKIDGLLAERMDAARPAAFNQAIMEFGALACTPVNPLCMQGGEICPFQEVCYAFRHKAIAHLPVKEKKKPLPVLQLHYMLVLDENDTVWLRKRGYEDLWRGMYDLPLVPQVSDKNMESVACEAPGLRLAAHYTQTLSHRKVHFYFYKADLSQPWVREFLTNQKNCVRVKKIALSKYAFPISVKRFLKELTIFND